MGIGVFLAVKQVQILEYLILNAYQNAGQQFLIGNGIGLEMIRHYVVNILDEYYIGIQVIEVFNECAVTSRTEQDRTVVVTERGAVGCCGYGIGAWFLLGERYVVGCSVAF